MIENVPRIRYSSPKDNDGTHFGSKLILLVLLLVPLITNEPVGANCTAPFWVVTEFLGGD